MHGDDVRKITRRILLSIPLSSTFSSTCQVEQVENKTDMWLYLLNHADELTEVPSQMAEVKEIRTAFEAAKRINLSAMELEELEKRHMYAMQEEENLAWARRDALEEGIEQGIEQGISQSVLDVLGSRFNSIPTVLQTRIEQLNQVVILRQALVQAAVCDSLDTFAAWLDEQTA